ncbi:hypothetical protein BCR25_18890 [Enterococcus termitis]|uniref:Uncharacterized protein n=1 Tax=Enterococcus termitis TaxID=332950 RepID=A0A1E5GQX5_9ENTE|nr:hypothetical protein BCR25_18890 [Enterococcus termitis]
MWYIFRSIKYFFRVSLLLIFLVCGFPEIVVVSFFLGIFSFSLEVPMELNGSVLFVAEFIQSNIYPWNILVKFFLIILLLVTYLLLAYFMYFRKLYLVHLFVPVIITVYIFFATKSVGSLFLSENVNFLWSIMWSVLVATAVIGSRLNIYWYIQEIYDKE